MVLIHLKGSGVGFMHQHMHMHMHMCDCTSRLRTVLYERRWTAALEFNCLCIPTEYKDPDA